MELYIVRHGETDWNSIKKIQGRADIQMNETGKRQVKRLAKVLSTINFDAVYTSPLNRAIETASIIAKNEKILIDDRLYEIEFGDLEGLIYDDILSTKESELDDQLKMVRIFFAKPEEYIPPKGGETYESLITRTSSFLEEIAKKHNNEKVLLVSHATCIHAMLTYMKEAPLNDLWSVKINNSSITKVKNENNRFMIIEEGRTV